MSDFDPFFHLKPPTARTVRESDLERLLALALPYLIAQRMTDTGDKLAELVVAIAREVA